MLGMESALPDLAELIRFSFTPIKKPVRALTAVPSECSNDPPRRQHDVHDHTLDLHRLCVGFDRVGDVVEDSWGRAERVNH